MKYLMLMFLSISTHAFAGTNALNGIGGTYEISDCAKRIDGRLQKIPERFNDYDSTGGGANLTLWNRTYKYSGTLKIIRDGEKVDLTVDGKYVAVKTESHNYPYKTYWPSHLDSYDEEGRRIDLHDILYFSDGTKLVGDKELVEMSSRIYHRERLPLKHFYRNNKSDGVSAISIDVITTRTFLGIERSSRDSLTMEYVPEEKRLRKIAIHTFVNGVKKNDIVCHLKRK